MEELFLGAFLVGEKLDVVDQQGIQRPVSCLELVDGVVLQCTNHIPHELLRVHIGHPCLRSVRDDDMANALHEVRFAKPDAPIDEQGVVATARIAADLQGRCPGHLVTLALDKFLEGVVRVQPAANGSSNPGLAPNGEGGSLQVGQAAHLDPHGRAGRFPEKLDDLVQAVAVYPIDHKAIGRQQPQHLAFFHALQGPDPGVELLFRQVGPQLLDAAAPERRLHGFTP